jgi:hypothetical protein
MTSTRQFLDFYDICPLTFSCSADSAARAHRPRHVPPSGLRARGHLVRSFSCFAFAVCLTFVIAASDPRPARAGSFVIGDCPAAADHANTNGPWEWVGEIESPSFQLKQECEGGTGDWLGLASVVFGPFVNGFGVDTMGTPEVITHLRVWWRAFGSTSESSVAEISVRNAAGYPLPGFSTPTTNTLWDTTAGPQELDFPSSDEASLVEVGERCSTECKSQTSALYEGIPLVVQLFGAELTVSDSLPPAVTLTGGPSESATPITGPVAMGFSASDPAVGIEKAELLVDGTPVASRDYSSFCTYTQLRPCPQTEADDLSIEGASLPEGEHQLAIRVTDGAGNTAVSASRRIATVRPPVANGRPCPNPAITASVAHRPTNSVRLTFGERPTIEGRLACGQTPLPGATVFVETVSGLGLRRESLATVQTAPDGTFQLRLPVGSNRRLTFRYYAYSNTSVPTAEAAVQIKVAPRFTLQIRPRHTRNDKSIHWRGRVEGGPYPTGGVRLAVQVKEGTRWQTFDEIAAHAGKIKYVYTFKRTTQPTTYTFRVAIPLGGDTGYEYAAGASRAIRVEVR